MADLSKFKFFWEAIWEDIKQSRRWKIVTISWLLIQIIWFVLWLVTTWSPAGLMSGTAILAFVCVSLLILLVAVVDGARRLYLKAVKELETKHEAAIAELELAIFEREKEHNKSTKIAKTFGRLVAMIEEHFLSLPPQQPAKKDYLEAWRNGAMYQFQLMFGSEAAKAFYDASNEGKPPPDTLEAQHQWMRSYTSKLNMIVTDQYIDITPPKKDRKNISDKAFGG